jgi:hypothetical protein
MGCDVVTVITCHDVDAVLAGCYAAMCLRAAGINALLHYGKLDKQLVCLLIIDVLRSFGSSARSH